MSDNWRKNLGSFLSGTDKTRLQREVSDIGNFIQTIVLPAFKEIKDELVSHGRTVTIRPADSSAAIIVRYHGDEEITYRVQGRSYPDRILPFAEIRVRERKGLKLVTIESMFRPGTEYHMSDITCEEVIQNFLHNYMSRVTRE